MFEAIQLCLELKGQTLLKYILEALQAQREMKSSSDESKKEEVALFLVVIRIKLALSLMVCALLSLPRHLCNE